MKTSSCPPARLCALRNWMPARSTEASRTRTRSNGSSAHLNISIPQLPSTWQVMDVQVQPWNERQSLVVTANTPSLGQITLVAAPMNGEDAVPPTSATDGAYSDGLLAVGWHGLCPDGTCRARAARKGGKGDRSRHTEESGTRSEADHQRFALVVSGRINLCMPSKSQSTSCVFLVPTLGSRSKIPDPPAKSFSIGRTGCLTNSCCWPLQTFKRLRRG